MIIARIYLVFFNWQDLPHIWLISYLHAMFNNTELQEIELADVKVKTENNKNLILYNDDVNTFEFVTESLIKICKHETIQAEQCTYLVHFTGKCSVKTAHYHKLKPMCEALLERGLTAQIE